MSKILPAGTEVYFFSDQGREGPDQFEKGVVEWHRPMSEMANYPYDDDFQYYKVVKEDGKYCFGTHGEERKGFSFLRTPSEHIAFLKERKRINEERINSLREENEQISDMIAEILLEEMAKPQPDFDELLGKGQK